MNLKKLKNLCVEIKLKLFSLRYKIRFIIDIKLKRYDIKCINKRGCGKTSVIYELARKYGLPILTQFEDQYRGYNVINPKTDGIERVSSFNNKVVLVDIDIIHSQSLLEFIYILSSRNNILIGFESEGCSNGREYLY